MFQFTVFCQYLILFHSTNKSLVSIGNEPCYTQVKRTYLRKPFEKNMASAVIISDREIGWRQLYVVHIFNVR